MSASRRSRRTAPEENHFPKRQDEHDTDRDGPRPTAFEQPRDRTDESDAAQNDSAPEGSSGGRQREQHPQPQHHQQHDPEKGRRYVLARHGAQRQPHPTNQADCKMGNSVRHYERSFLVFTSVY
jgi:hypothetical protein